MAEACPRAGWSGGNLQAAEVPDRFVLVMRMCRHAIRATSGERQRVNWLWLCGDRRRNGSRGRESGIYRIVRIARWASSDHQRVSVDESWRRVMRICKSSIACSSAWAFRIANAGKGLCYVLRRYNLPKISISPGTMGSGEMEADRSLLPCLRSTRLPRISHHRRVKSSECLQASCSYDLRSMPSAHACSMHACML